jgi:hypothetical protein
MAAYIVFTREGTRNPAELEAYTKKARATWPATRSRRAWSMAVTR